MPRTPQKLRPLSLRKSCKEFVWGTKVKKENFKKNYPKLGNKAKRGLHILSVQTGTLSHKHTILGLFHYPGDRLLFNLNFPLDWGPASGGLCAKLWNFVCWRCK